MSKHRNAALWMGLAAVAVITLAMGTRPQGEQAKTAESGGKAAFASTPQPAPKPEDPKELIAKRYQAALHSPHRLEWAPAEMIPSNVVFDLCDEAQAMAAGLSPHWFNDSREAHAVDCRTTRNRFAYVPPHESMRTADSLEEAQAVLTELARTRTIKGEHFPEPVGSLMSHHGTGAMDMDPCGNGFGCDFASIDVSRGTTRGLFVNVSDEVAHNVTISAGNVVARHPLSVQPAEITAFELSAELSAAELATLSISATFVASADPRRAVHLLGAPGDITGQRDELARRFLGIDSNDPPVVTYFLEAVMLENSTSHPAVARTLPGHVLDAPTAVVTLLDERRKVIEVLRPPVAFVADPGKSQKPEPVTTMAFDTTYTIGYVMPPEVASYFISIGGAE